MIYLDMDGTIVDLVPGLAEFFKVPIPTHYPEDHNLDAAFGLPIPWEMTTREFWSGLRPTPEYLEILGFVSKLKAPVSILSSLPIGHRLAYKACAQGKLDWLIKWRLRIPVILTDTSKSWFADNESLLIDDHDSNIQGFRDAGGNALTIKRPWNSEEQSVSEVFQKFLESGTWQPGVQQVQKSTTPVCEGNAP